ELLSSRYKGHPNTTCLSDLPCPCARCIDYDRRPNGAAVRLDPRHLTALDQDSFYSGIRQKRCPIRFGTARESYGDLRRVEIHIVTDTHHPNYSLGLKERIQAVCLLRRNSLNVKPK